MTSRTSSTVPMHTSQRSHLHEVHRHKRFRVCGGFEESGETCHSRPRPDGVPCISVTDYKLALSLTIAESKGAAADGRERCGRGVFQMFRIDRRSHRGDRGGGGNGTQDQGIKYLFADMESIHPDITCMVPLFMETVYKEVMNELASTGKLKSYRLLCDFAGNQHRRGAY